LLLRHRIGLLQAVEQADHDQEPPPTGPLMITLPRAKRKVEHKTMHRHGMALLYLPRLKQESCRLIRNVLRLHLLHQRSLRGLHRKNEWLREIRTQYNVEYGEIRIIAIY
jgi:hypothetical protein